MKTKLGINERQKLRDLCTEAKGSQDYTLHLVTALENVLTEFDIALELLTAIIRAKGAYGLPLYEGIEKFVGRHKD